MHTEAKHVTPLTSSKNPVEVSIKMIRNYIEYALMRTYAQRKINVRYLYRDTVMDKGLQSEIERALSSISTTSIEKIWRLGTKIVNEIIYEASGWPAQGNAVGLSHLYIENPHEFSQRIAYELRHIVNSNK